MLYADCVLSRWVMFGVLRRDPSVTRVKICTNTRERPIQLSCRQMHSAIAEVAMVQEHWSRHCSDTNDTWATLDGNSRSRCLATSRATQVQECRARDSSTLCCSESLHPWADSDDKQILSRVPCSDVWKHGVRDYDVFEKKKHVR